MKTFLISDTHFYHKNVIEYCNRPFISVEEMNNYIISNWNKVVGKEDIVYHLGDFALGWDKNFPSKRECYKKLLEKLNGKKILIKGNHDRETDNFYKDVGFENVYPYFILGGKLLVHYPLEINEFQKESLQNFIYKLKGIVKEYGLSKIIHGHIHNNFSKLPSHYNVSVEAIDYTPVELQSIEKSLF